MTIKVKLFHNILSISTVFICLLVVMTGLFLMPTVVSAQADIVKKVQVDTSNAGLVTKVAPGEILPISVKLLNFGGGPRTDVFIKYSIFSSTGAKIHESAETVAVETTATFIKTIQISDSTVPGTYTAQTSITYQGQTFPATTSFTFSVERKFLGLFVSDFFLFGIGGVASVFGIIMVILGYSLLKHHRKVRLSPFDYSDIPHDQRTFYEILSDTIMEMRGRVGDDALLIAANIDGLEIDKKTGRVLNLTEHPSKIIATLLAEYEKLLGKKVSLSFRSNKKDL